MDSHWWKVKVLAGHCLGLRLEVLSHTKLRILTTPLPNYQLRLAWCLWPWICYTLILRVQCLPCGEQEGSYPVGGQGQVSYLNMPRQAQPRPVRPSLGCDLCLVSCSLVKVPSQERSRESSRMERSPFPCPPQLPTALLQRRAPLFRVPSHACQ